MTLAKYGTVAEAFPSVDQEHLESLTEIYLRPEVNAGMTDFEVKRLPASSNNKLFAIQSSGPDFTQRAVAKFYGARDDPTRADHTFREANALTFLQSQEIYNVPGILAQDISRGVVVMTFVDGQAKDAARYTEDDISKVVDFILQLQSFGPDAAVGMRSVPLRRSFIDTPTYAQERLHKSANASAHLPEALRQYLHDNGVFNQYQAFEEEIILGIAERNPWRIDDADLRLSANDAGAHNVLFAADGPYFIDFEHFGWNDPIFDMANMLAHNSMLDLPPELCSHAIEQYEKQTALPEAAIQRLRPSIALCHLEWAARCIETLTPAKLRSRRFANGNFDPEAYTQAQIGYLERHLGYLAACVGG